MDTNLYKIIIGAYLHDIGKLLRRWWKNRSKNHHMKVAHAQQVFDFLQQFENSFRKNDIALIAGMHHAKDFCDYNRENNEIQSLARCVYMGDNLWSTERIDEENIEEKESDRTRLQNIWLTTTFENIYNDKKVTSQKTYRPETLQDSIFDLIDKWYWFEESFEKNITQKIGDCEIYKWFKNLKDKFIKDIEDLIKKYENIEKEDYSIFVSKLDILFQNYLTFVPSDTYKSIWDISLYDHVKLTVAYAAILYNSWYYKEFEEKYFYEKGNSDTDKIKQAPTTLIAGDFPSIQQYIFWWMQKAKYLAKRLRARSLRVQLLNEAVVQYVLDKLSLPRANVLMNAGGKFVILAPSDITVDHYRSEINRFLLKEFGGNIKFSLIAQQHTIWEIAGKWKQHKKIFQDLFKKLSHNKFQCYDETNVKMMFQQQNIGGKLLCKYCGQNYFDSENDENYESTDHNKKDDMCQHCQQEIDLGEQIVRENIISIGIDYHKADEFTYQEIFSNDQWQLQILFNNRSHQDLWNSFGIAKSINLHVPENKEKETTKDFGELANKNGYLCLLKGDIDAMSLVFKHGFGEHYSISRLVQFSRFLELFFGKYLQQKLTDSFPDVYTVFSGWDDFVFVVPFDERKKFIQSLYKEFQTFVGQNQYLHFSIWLGIFKHKTPFKQVDKYTEELLKSAKQQAKKWLSTKQDLSNYAVCFYEKEFVNVYGEKISGITNTSFDPNDLALQRSLDDEKSSMLYKVYTTLKEMRQDLECETPKWSDFVLKWARLLYMIGRNTTAEQFAKIQQELAFLKTIGQEEVETKKEEINALLLKLVDGIYEKR